MWQKAVQPYVAAGELIALGCVQEQHPDRTRLYRQWRALEWPIFVDSMNTIDLDAVPVPVLIDEHGIVRHMGANVRQLDAFMNRSPDEPEGCPQLDAPDGDDIANAPEDELARVESLFHVGDAADLDSIVEALIRLESDAGTGSDGRLEFRLGVAYRRRYESAHAQPGDAQRAVDAWTEALAANPNQYIWRRRLQQYGPRLDKPYNFYFWVAQARKDLSERGEEPWPLPVEPMGTELAPPGDAAASNPSASIENRDPEARITRDKRGLVQIEPVVTPSRVQPGRRVMARVAFALRERAKPWWNNEADDLYIWADLPEGISVSSGAMTTAGPEEPETQELRHIEIELAIDAATPQGEYSIPAYALYYVCEDSGGVCYFLRQDFEMKVVVDSSAPKLK